jgi:pyruvate/2-oxoacid:ferredoxin oxidoreductase beta subunit/Pyruvate/2-oxoacid:ferredoxin oxidoreductase gamma subunit
VSSLQYSSYYTDKNGALPFCPGCGHNLLIKSLDKALVKLQKDPKGVVIVTDIGCIGLSDRYFITNAFHGLHGRSITYACGLKLARPELTVIVLQGDGGCGIGGAHLLNVARRNIGITLIIGNNFNYGMTGGQHSVTTPTQGMTSTTSWGNVEGPMNLCSTAAAAGASWVYRATAFDKDLPEAMAQAIEQPGFSMIDVWELCTAYYSPRNKMGRNELFKLIDGYGFKLGLIEHNPRPEYSINFKKAFGTNKKKVRVKPIIEKKYSNNVDKQTGIVIAGSAGQKIRSVATLFAEASMYSGLEATQKDDYPITVMTGHSVSEVIVSPEPIDYTAIDSPDYFIVISKEGLKRTHQRIKNLSKDCILIVDESLELPETQATIFKMPILSTAKTIGKYTATITAISTFLEYTRIFPTQALEEAIQNIPNLDIRQLNMKALRTAVEMVIKN